MKSSILDNPYYQSISEKVSEDVWKRIELLQPKTKVEFSSIFGLGPVTLKNIEEEVNAIESELLSNRHKDLSQKLKVRLEILRDRLINISQRNNIIWNSKETKNRLIDLSKLSEGTIKKISELFNNGQERSVRLEVEGMNNEEVKEMFISIFRENEKQKIEKGRSILYIAPAIFMGKVKIENKDIKLRAPLFMFPVSLELNKVNDSWYLEYDQSRDVVTNPFIEKYILKKVNEYDYDFDVSLNENIDRICSYIPKVSNGYFEMKSFEKITVNDTWPYMNNEFSVANNLLMGLFSDFSNEIEAELEHLIYHMDSTPMLNRFLSNEDFHSRDDVVRAKNLIESKINNDVNLTYTNKLNEQQLRALKLINEPTMDGLTIWGPPGTGKSETIISIVENAIAKGQKVAVVSEKQAALDVIKKRLNIISDNSIMISDTKDKLGFYSQLAKMVDREYYKHDSTSKHIKTDIKKAYVELDSIYEKFGYNNKNVFEQVRDMFHHPLYETPLSKRMHYESEFDAFNNIDLEAFQVAFDFIESIDSRERLKLLITVSNKYYGKFANFESIEESVARQIREKINEIKNIESLIEMEPQFKDKLLSFHGFFGPMKKWFYKKSLARNYELDKQDFKDILLGSFVNVQKQKILFANQFKDELIAQLEWVEPRRHDIDLCLKLDVHNLNLIKLIDIDDIHNSKEAIKINLIRRLLKSSEFSEKMEILRTYDDKVKEIKELHNQFGELSKVEVMDSLDKNLSNVTINKRENNIIKIAHKKRPMAIRKFMNDYSLEIKSLVNVWLMQPEVIPALFSLQDEFDLVIFDEASQVFLERSIPAIARAKKLVVLGDEKQLGPSSFFAGRITSEDKEDEILEENESLLTYSRSKLPEIMLKKHYRSKDVNLIRFSSERYYEGGLDFINDNTYNDDSLEYYFVEDSNYEDGRNKAEGDKVIEILRTYKNNNSPDSIGIITANSKQETYIFNTLITHHFDLFEWLKDNNSFIKSIENVQGDERDVIIFATTYGPENGNQRINFGPINQALGSNRINVAITRAKKKMIVVSSIDIDQALNKVQNSVHQGPRDFIDYIKFVKDVSTGEVTSVEMKESEFNNIFKNEATRIIRDIAEESGLGIRTNYEGLGYVLDVVVYDKDTNKNLLTILLDSPDDDKMSREKDFLAQEFLESRGWRVHRIWSPNWWTRNTKEISIIEELVQEVSGGLMNEEFNQLI